MNRLSSISQQSFPSWLKTNPVNRRLLIAAAIVTLLQFAGFKALYPYPNFSPDSYSYLEAAYNNSSINLWPIGYSKFLRLVSCITDSDIFLVFVQYILLQASSIYLLLTVYYLLPVRTWLKYITFICIILNPVSLYISNLVSSDCLFVSLSLIWLTQLIWILFYPTAGSLFLHAIILLSAFTTRYNALFYPLISFAVIAASPLRAKYKAQGIVMICISIASFVVYTKAQYKKRTGISTFSGFAGWQMANNALYAYSHIRPENRKSTPPRFGRLHAMVNRHIDALSRLNNRPDANLASYFLWDRQSPLDQYMRINPKLRGEGDVLKYWATMSPMYLDYGYYLIGEYKGAFVKYYLFPNLVSYLIPNAEFLGFYNMNRDTVDLIAVKWFNYGSNKVYANIKEGDNSIIRRFPAIHATMNALFVLSLAGFLLLGGWRKSTASTRKLLALLAVIWITSLSFSVFASPIVLRYQVFSCIFTACAVVLFANFFISIFLPQENTASNKSLSGYFA